MSSTTAVDNCVSDSSLTDNAVVVVPSLCRSYTREAMHYLFLSSDAIDSFLHLQKKRRHLVSGRPVRLVLMGQEDDITTHDIVKIYAVQEHYDELLQWFIKRGYIVTSEIKGDGVVPFENMATLGSGWHNQQIDIIGTHLRDPESTYDRCDHASNFHVMLAMEQQTYARNFATHDAMYCIYPRALVDRITLHQEMVLPNYAEQFARYAGFKTVEALTEIPAQFGPNGRCVGDEHTWMATMSDAPVWQEDDEEEEPEHKCQFKFQTIRRFAM